MTSTSRHPLPNNDWRTPAGSHDIGQTSVAILMTPTEVSQYLGVPIGTLANWRYQHRGPAFIRLGRHVRYRATDLTRWLEQLTQASDRGSPRPSARIPR